MDYISGRTIVDLWEDRARLSPTEPFLEYEALDKSRASFTYRQFNQRIDRTARALDEEFELDKGQRVLLHLPNSPVYLETWFALMKLGIVVVHSNTNHTAREVNFTLSSSGASLAVTTPDYSSLIDKAREETELETVVYGQTEGGQDFDRGPRLTDLTEGVEASLPVRDVAPDDTAQIIYTSGTTSTPKGVLHTHANLIASGERYAKHAAMQPTDRALTALPLYHVNAQSISTLSTLTTGGVLVLLEEFKASQYIDQLRRHRATITSLIGTQVRAMLAREESDNDSDNDLREVSFSINVTDEEKKDFEDRFDVRLLNEYGLSEAMTIVSIAPVHGERRWPSIGRPTYDHDVYIVDDDGNSLGAGERGEIAVDGERGVSLMKGYDGQPEQTDEAFTDQGWLLTGDYGRLDEDGFLYFLDRKKNIIETRGENVSEGEVESVLENHPEVEEAGVIGVPHEFYGEAVMAYVLSRSDRLSETDLLAYARKNLADFKVPETIEYVDEFPRTSIGKIEKSTLRDSARENTN